MIADGTMIIRADASARIGIGHIMRCFALAQAWRTNGGRAIFLSHNVSSHIHQRIVNAGMELIPLECVHPDSEDLETTLKTLQTFSEDTDHNRTWLVLDGYHFDPAYQEAVRTAGYSLLVIDDTAHLPTYHANIIVNQNPGSEKLKYTADTDTVVLLGPRYALLREDFQAWRHWRREIPPTARKLLVTLGGGDHDNVTLKVIYALKEIRVEGLETVVIVGGSNPNYGILQSEVGNLPCSLRLERDPPDLPGLMTWADVAITAGGSTCWELAFTSVPSLVLATAANQIRGVQHLEASGAVMNLGWHQEVTSTQIAQSLLELMTSKEKRAQLAQVFHAMVDGEGTDRVQMKMQGNPIRLRRVKEEDKFRLWAWANEPEVRVASFSPGPIPWETHAKWFALKLEDPNCVFYIALDEADRPLGQVRFDVNDVEAIISISLDAKFRGQGYGPQIVALASRKFFIMSRVNVIHAYIREGNVASANAFMKANFFEDMQVTVHGETARHFKLIR